MATQAITKVNGIFKVAADKSINIFLKEVLPLNTTGEAYEQSLDIDKKRSFSLNVNLKKPGFFTLSIVMSNGKDKSGYTNVIYLTPQSKLNLEYQEVGRFGLACNYSKINDIDNRALLEIHERYNAHLRILFAGTLDSIRQKEELKAFYQIAENVMAKSKLSPVVKKYITFKAFDTYNSNLYRLALDYNRKGKTNGSPGAAYYAQPVDPLFYFNDPTILLFSGSGSNLNRYLEVCADMPVYKSRKSLSEINTLIVLLKSKISNKPLADAAIESLLRSFTSSYKVATDFDNDLKAFAKTANEINDLAIRSEVKKDFENLRYTMTGAALPLVNFENANGETISLDQFKGKYLFIDLWASWCVPCIKMTPFVQQLEKEYEGKNITFVAISIDGNKQSWLSKMKELNMHGHQLLDLPGAFAKKLNITGIPHYMIYDPEGKLVVYKAMMPDSPKLKETIDQLLAK